MASVVAQTASDREIIVVDNRSEASVEIARIVAGFAEAQLVASPRNLGFTGGMNLGLRQARGRYVLFTEDDITLPPDCATTFIGYLESHETTGMVTGRVVEATTGAILYAGGDVTLGPVWTSRVTGLGESDKGQYTEPRSVTYAPGCTLLASRALLDTLGGFREDFYLYYEDVDLTLRMRASGHGVVCLPGVRLLHHASVPTGNARLVAFHKLKNLAALYVLHAPARVLPEFLVRYAIITPLRELVSDVVRFSITVRAWLWVIAHLPSLIAGRFAIAALRREAVRR